MIKNLLIVLVLLCTPVVAGAAQQTLGTASGTSHLEVRSTINSNATKSNSNFTELYNEKSDKTAVVRYWTDWPTSSPNNVLAINTIVAFDGKLYKATQQVTKTGGTPDPATLTTHFTGVGAGDNLGSATASDVAALFSGSGDCLKSDGTKGDCGTGSVDLSNYLSKTNTTSYTPTADYHPATKKYVDDAVTAGGGYTDEMAQDAVGGMFTGNTETGITVTYDDATGKVNFVVASQFDGSQSTTGSAGSIGGMVTASGITGALNLTKTGTTARTVTFPNKAGTVAFTDDIVAAPTDATITTTDVTTNNASTTKHGWLVKATAPSSGLRNVVAIDNGETVYTNKALFDATSPSTQAFGDTASVGSAMTAARRDHKHAMPAAPTTITGNAGTATALAANGTNCSAGQAALGVDASGNAEGCWTPTGSGTPGGSNTQVQFNDGGTSFGGDAGLTYNKTTDSLTVVGTVTAGTFASSAADGSRRSILPNNTTISPSAGGVVEIYNEGGAIKAVEADTEYDVLLSRDIGSSIQAYDGDLAALAAPTAWRLYYSNGSSAQTALTFGALNTFMISGGTSAAPSFYDMTTSINSGAPNGTGAKVHWSQLTGVPAGFADGSDDGSGGGITHAASDGTYYASRNGAWSAFTSGNYTLAMTLTGNTAVTLPTSGTLATTVASGTSALGTSAISSGACATVVTTSATGVATTDVINWGFNGDPTGVTGYAPSANGMLTIIAYPSSNNVNYKVCNNTASSITPGAITLNWRVNR